MVLCGLHREITFSRGEQARALCACTRCEFILARKFEVVTNRKLETRSTSLSETLFIDIEWLHVIKLHRQEINK